MVKRQEGKVLINDISCETLNIRKLFNAMVNHQC